MNISENGEGRDCLKVGWVDGDYSISGSTLVGGALLPTMDEVKHTFIVVVFCFCFFCCCFFVVVVVSYYNAGPLITQTPQSS